MEVLCWDMGYVMCYVIFGGTCGGIYTTIGYGRGYGDTGIWMMGEI